MNPSIIQAHQQVRVVTRILNAYEYSRGVAAPNLDNKSGRINRASHLGGRLYLLVEFDKPAMGWPGSPASCPSFWFPSSDVLSLQGEEDKLSHLISHLTFELTGKAS